MRYVNINHLVTSMDDVAHVESIAGNLTDVPVAALNHLMGRRKVANEIEHEHHDLQIAVSVALSQTA